MENKFFAAGCLAGAYRGSTEVTLNHLVSDSAFVNGRMKRADGEAFCNKKLNMVDFYGYEPVSQVDCPKCQEILAKLKK